MVVSYSKFKVLKTNLDSQRVGPTVNKIPLSLQQMDTLSESFTKSYYGVNILEKCSKCWATQKFESHLLTWLGTKLMFEMKSFPEAIKA